MFDIRGVNAAFITTHTDNCDPIVNAWNFAAQVPAARISFNPGEAPMDREIVQFMREAKPEVIFYIGAVHGPGLPSFLAFKHLREIAPLVHLCFDGGDDPWWPVLLGYQRNGCFDLQVNIDGADCPHADLVTLCPIDPRPFDTPSPGPRSIPFGFAGGVAGGQREEIVNRMKEIGLQVRLRGQSYTKDDYRHYAAFLRSCRIVLNVPFTGTGKRTHVKARIIETGLAGAAVADFYDSPAVRRWFGSDAILAYDKPEYLQQAIANLTDIEIDTLAANLKAQVRGKYSPGQIYGRIMTTLDAKIRG